MSSRRLGTGFSLPTENVEYLEFNASDGNPANWPTSTTRIVDKDGHVNFMQHLELDSPTAAKWRVSVGKSIAMDMKLSEGKTYIMRSWPTGYRMYDHHKGPASNPRHDVYLFGPTSIRFRSINEFIPHAIWLMRDAKDKTTCFCKYCSKTKSQKEITASMGALAATPYQASTSGRAKTSARERKLREPFLRRSGKAGQDQAIYAAVQRIPKPVEALKPSANITTKYAMLVERNADLRAMYTRSGIDEEDSAIGQKGVMKMRRWYRERELVWCALTPPIVDEDTNVAIKFWPGIVDEVKLHSEGVPNTTATPENSNENRKAPDMSNTDQTLVHSGSAMQLDDHTHPNGAPPHQSAEETLEPAPPSDSPTPTTVPWSIRQHITYRVQLLAISHWCDALDDQVLPYQAYVPPAELIQAMQSVPATKLEFERETLERFNPCPGLGPGESGPVSAAGANLTSVVDGVASTSSASASAGPSTKAFEDAIAPFAMAVQIGSQISEYWSLSDDWEFEYKITRPLGAGGRTHGSNAALPVQPQPQLAQASSSLNAQSGLSSTPAPSISTDEAGPSVPSGPLSLQSALEAAAQHNAGVAAGKMKASSSAPASVPSSTPAPLLSNQPNPSAPMPTPHFNGDLNQTVEERIIQTRFQGLWWGAERIWTDEMIRLKVPRRCLAPKGAQNILAPAGPGKRVKGDWETMGRDSAELGAATRGVFMKLDGLFILEVKDGDEGGIRKECRACGMLYELVDDDWEDPNRDQQEQQQPQQPPSPPPQPSQPSQQINSGSGPIQMEGSLMPNTQLSTPSLPVNPTATNGETSPSTLSSPYPLPPAPSGYKFRAILPQGFEAVVSLSLISGRYYPRILSHPLMRETLEQALGNSLENGGLMVYNNLWALEGLAAGLYNSVDPMVYKVTREKMVADADKEARGLLEVHRTEKLRGEGQGESVSESGGQGSTDVPMAQGDEGMREVVMNGTSDIQTHTSGSVDELAAMDVDS